MENPVPPRPTAADSIPQMPLWVRLDHGQSSDDVAFLSGAALSHLHLVAACAKLPFAFWREHLALVVAEACAGFVGPKACAAELRDAVHFLRPGDHPGPAGEILQHWQSAVTRKVTVPALGRALAGLTVDQITRYLAQAGLDAAR